MFVVTMEIVILLILFFIIALVYSAAGFGGGSSYIAVLLLFGLAINDIRFTALLCNIAVVGGSVYNFHKAELLKWKELTPLIIFSIPMAYLGGRMTANPEIYFPVTGIALIVISVLMLKSKKQQIEKNQLTYLWMSLIGGSIGFLSGFIGIGGGVFLAPILYYFNWGAGIRISAATSLFILVNSFFGLAGQLGNIPQIDMQLTSVLLLAVIFGGQIGNRLNIHFLSGNLIKTITGILIGVVGIRILIPYLQL
ncbi:MAG: sulfite exporter TauE/SafE family protein [Saprospiraceae bacterium]|nr:sulfite exporter TauE/SafE family protein [Saprospiraceae bacterium]